MLILQIEQPGSFALASGERYVMDDHTAGHYLVEGWGTVVPGLSPAGRRDAKGEGLLLMRAGGFGDLVCLRPIIEAWQNQQIVLEGSIKVGVCAHRSHWDALAGLSEVELVPYPMPASALEGWERVVDLSGVIEREDAVKGWDSVEAMARAVWPQEDQRFFDGLVPEMPVEPEDLMQALERWPRKEATGTVALRVGIALSASARCRTWPLERLGELLEALGTGCEVFLLGAPGPWPEIRLEGPVKHIHVLPRQNVSMRQSLGLLSSLDVLVAPDTGLLHAAGALGVPAVGIFGPFQARQRVARYPTVRVIQGAAPCAPCSHHPRTHERTWPAGKPCQVMQHCVAMASTSGAQVAAVVREILAQRGMTKPE